MLRFLLFLFWVSSSCYLTLWSSSFKFYIKLAVLRLLLFEFDWGEFCPKELYVWMHASVKNSLMGAIYSTTYIWLYLVFPAYDSLIRETCYKLYLFLCCSWAIVKVPIFKLFIFENFISAMSKVMLLIFLSFCMFSWDI